MKNSIASPGKIAMPEFPVSRESAYTLLILSDADTAHVVKAVASYFLFGKEPEAAFDGIAESAYSAMRNDIDKSGAGYRGKSGRRKSAGESAQGMRGNQESVESPDENKDAESAMLFDFDTFNRIVSRVYPPDSKYTLQDVLSVFRAYFQRYEQETGRAHPNIRAEQIKAIIKKMPFIERGGFQNTRAEIKPSEYPALIEKHFQTKYRNCDYNVNHFFSGRIRELRYYEDTWRKNGKGESQQ